MCHAARRSPPSMILSDKNFKRVLIFANIRFFLV
jgi:hypothetical protein